MVGRCISYWNCPFLGDMLIFQWCTFLHPDLSPPRTHRRCQVHPPSSEAQKSSKQLAPWPPVTWGGGRTCDRPAHGGRWVHPPTFWTHKKKLGKIQNFQETYQMISNSTDSYNVSTKKMRHASTCRSQSAGCFFSWVSFSIPLNKDILLLKNGISKTTVPWSTWLDIAFWGQQPTESHYNFRERSHIPPGKNKNHLQKVPKMRGYVSSADG